MKTKNKKATTVDPLDEYYYNYFLHGDPDNSEFMTDFYKDNWMLVDSISLFLKHIYDVLSVFSIIINLFHFFILARKELRTNLVYMIMIGICLCDIIQSVGNLAQVIYSSEFLYEIVPCLGALKLSHLMADLVSKTLQIWSRRCSNFLTLYIATLRALSIIFPMSNRVAAMTQPLVGILVMIFVGITFGAWSALYFLWSKFEKVYFCEPDPELYNDYYSNTNLYRPSYVPYRLVENQPWEPQYLMIDGFISWFISVSYIFVAFALAIAIRAANKKRKSLKNESEQQSTSTSALVLLMGITVFLSETAYGLLYLANNYYFVGFKEQYHFKIFGGAIMQTLTILNSTTHAVMCFCMSSQYRDTVKNMFWRKKQEKTMDPIPVSTVPSVKESSEDSMFSKRSI